MSQDKNETDRVPVGGIVFGEGDIEINPGRTPIRIKVRNTGDRPIQVCSHYHFFEVNRFLEFDRTQAFGMRLDVPATTGVRFEPGDEREIDLIPYSGKRRLYGFAGLVNGWTGGDDAIYRPNHGVAIRRAQHFGFMKNPDEQK